MSDDLYNQIIQPNFTKLLKDVRPKDIVDLLYQYGVINADDMEIIDRKSQYSCHRDGMKELLNILRQKGPEAVRMFVSVLGEAEYAHLEKQLKKKLIILDNISENRPLPEPTSKVLENHSNRILQLELEVATLRAEKQAEAQNFKSENSEMKKRLSALESELNDKKETKNQNEYRSQNQETRGQIPFTQPNRNERKLTPEELREKLKAFAKAFAKEVALQKKREDYYRP